VEEPGVGGGQALLVSVLPEEVLPEEVLPEALLLEAVLLAAVLAAGVTLLLPPARAAPIGTVSATAMATPNSSLNRRISSPSCWFCPI
jgi:hypothetical protein